MYINQSSHKHLSSINKIQLFNQNDFNNFWRISPNKNSRLKVIWNSLNPARKFPYLNASLKEISPAIILLAIVYSG